MRDLEPIRAVFRQAGLYSHAADDLLCQRLAKAMAPKDGAGDLGKALDAARGEAVAWADDDEIKLSREYGGSFNAWLTKYPGNDTPLYAAPTAASDALAELDHARSRIDELTTQLDHARRRIGELTIQLGEVTKPAALALPAPLPPTPDTMNLTDAQREVEDAFRRGWNSCRATVMQAPPAAAVPEVLVRAYFHRFSEVEDDYTIYHTLDGVCEQCIPVLIVRDTAMLAAERKGE